MNPLCILPPAEKICEEGMYGKYLKGRKICGNLIRRMAGKSRLIWRVEEQIKLAAAKFGRFWLNLPDFLSTNNK